MWESSAPARAYKASPEDGFVEVDSSAFASLPDRHFDPSLDAVVSLDRSGSSATIRVVPLNGDPVISNAIALPVGYALRELTVGSGNTLMVVERSGGGQELHWWDSLTGEPGGTLALPLYGDGVSFSANGRAVLLWDLDGWVVHVIDAADPGTPATVALGACRGNSVGQVSSDGRWFVFADCLSRLRVVDLSDVAAGWSPLGVKQGAGLAFAVDTPELVWVDADGVVRTLDVPTRQPGALLELSAEEIARLDIERGWWGPPLYLNRGAQLLGLTKGDGRVTLVNFGSPSTSEALPRPTFELAVLDLVAVRGDQWPEFESYQFSGSVDVAGLLWRIEGYVYGCGIQRYVPAQAGVQPQISPPRLGGYAEVWTDGEAELSYTLTFGTSDRQATSYLGMLSQEDESMRYVVRLQRSAP